MHTGLHTTALMTKLSLHAIRSATTSYRSDETLITTFKNILAIHLLVCKLLPPNCFPFCFHLFLRTFQQPNPFCCYRPTTNLFIISVLSRTITISLSFWAYGFICGWPRPISSRSAKQPGWRSPPIVTIVTIFFLSLWIYLWLAETSQQPISQTTWLKVTPHCNHCKHFLSELMDLFVTGRVQSAANQPNNLAEGHPPL